jgi:hypothetical protein
VRCFHLTKNIKLDSYLCQELTFKLLFRYTKFTPFGNPPWEERGEQLHWTGWRWAILSSLGGGVTVGDGGGQEQIPICDGWGVDCPKIPLLRGGRLSLTGWMFYFRPTAGVD